MQSIGGECTTCGQPLSIHPPDKDRLTWGEGQKHMKRILVAEDRPRSLKVLRTVLEAAGYEVIEALDGREAVEKHLAIRSVRFC
jgi:PleD family two-component response regulator